MDIQITKSNSESYELHGDGYYFNVTLVTYPYAPHTGRLTINGEFNGSHYWNACGRDFKKFLRQLDMDYFYSKMIEGEYRKIDMKQSLPYLKKKIINARKEGQVNKKQARKLWESLRDFDPHMSNKAVAMWMEDDGWGDIFPEYNPNFPTKTPHHLQVFWDHFRPALFEMWEKQ